MLINLSTYTMQRINYGKYHANLPEIEKYKKIKVESIAMPNFNDLDYGAIKFELQDGTTKYYNIGNNYGGKMFYKYFTDLYNSDKINSEISVNLFPTIDDPEKLTLQILTTASAPTTTLTITMSGIYEYAFGYDNEIKNITIEPSISPSYNFKFKYLKNINHDIAVHSNIIESENLTTLDLSKNENPLFLSNSDILGVLYQDSDFVYRGYNTITYDKSNRTQVEIYFDSSDYKLPNTNIVLYLFGENKKN